MNLLRRQAGQSGSAVIIAIVIAALIAIVAIVLVVTGGDDDTRPTTPADSAPAPVATAAIITEPEFEVTKVEFSLADDHIVADISIINHEAVPVTIQCPYAAGDKSGGGAFAGDWGSYVLQPGQNSFSDEIFSNPTGGSGITGTDLVADFDELNFSIAGDCQPAWVLDSFNADDSPTAVPVLRYLPGYLARDFGELRYRPASPDTCQYRLESSEFRRDRIDPPVAWNDYGDDGPNGVVIDGIFHTHILAHDCGQWQRNSLECEEWDEVQILLDNLWPEDELVARRPESC